MGFFVAREVGKNLQFWTQMYARLQILFLAFCWLPVVALSAPKVKQLKLEEHLVALELPESEAAAAGDQWVITFANGEQCRLEIIEVKETAVIAKALICPRESEIVVGLAVEKDLFGKKPVLAPEAAPAPAPVTEAPPEGDLNGLKSKNESWYTFWGLGFSTVRYLSPEDRATADALSSSPGVQHSTINLDLLGFYWPLSGHHSMLGVVVNTVGDRWSDNTGAIQISQYTASFSGMTFFGTNIGDGVFLRMDIGPAWYSVSSSIGSGTETTYRSGLGFGWLFGGGYAIPISPDTRVLLGMYYSLRSISQTDSRTFSLSAGFLF